VFSYPLKNPHVFGSDAAATRSCNQRVSNIFILYRE